MLTPERTEQVRKLHERALVIDAHNDSLRAIAVGDPRYNPPKEGPPRPRRLWQQADTGHWDFPRALAAGQTGQLTNILVPRPRDGPFLRTCLKSYQSALADLETAPQLARIATSAADLEGAKRDGVVALVLGLEGAEGFEGDLDILHLFHRLGVRAVGLTWMYRNEVAEGNWEDTGAGLSDFGRTVIREMNQLQMLVDVAHSTEQTFWDALETSSSPVICSHTSCRALVKDFGTHAESRYLTDEQMKALAEQGGVLGVFFSANRELADEKADVSDLARFFAHAAAVVGAEHLGFGSDFDGGFPPPGLEDIRGLPNLTGALLDVGFSEEEVLGIVGGNWLRVFRQVWGG